MTDRERELMTPRSSLQLSKAAQERDVGPDEEHPNAWIPGHIVTQLFSDLPKQCVKFVRKSTGVCNIVNARDRMIKVVKM